MFFGCHRSQQSHWEALYSEAREYTDQHQSARAAEIANRGFQDTEATGPILNYKFRVLKAELTYSNPRQVLELLEMEPPPELKSGEFGVRRKITQGLAHGYLGDLPEAKICFEEASQLASTGKPELLPKVIFAEAYLASDQKDKEEAEKDYRMSADLARKYQQPWAEADALINLAKIQMDDERYDAAIDSLSKTLDNLPRFRSSQTGEMILGKLGWSFYQIGEFNRAISFLKDAESASAKIGRTEDQELWSVDLGDAYLVRGDHGNAEKFYLNAYAIAKNLDSKKEEVIALNNLAQLELRRDETKKALEYNQEALGVEKGIDGDRYSHSLCALTTAEIAIRQNQLPQAERLLSGILKTANDSSILWQAQSDLANLYVNEKKAARAEQEFEAAIRTVEKARKIVKQEERRMSILDAWPFYDDYIRFLIHQNQQFKALEIAEFSRARTLTEGLGIVDPSKKVGLSLQRVQGLLKMQHQIILAYWLAEKESYLWLLSPSLFKVWRLPPEGQIKDEIEAYTAKLVAHKDIDDSAPGQKLYELLVRPAEKFIPAKARIIVIPHSSLYKLNFETLVVPGPKLHYWIDDVTVKVAGSMSLLADSNEAATNNAQKLLLIGAPVQVSDEFPVLPNAGEEIEKVKAHFPPSEEVVIPGKGATPSAYRSSHPEAFGVIHFVTHGMASDTNPLDSAIILSPQGDGNFKLYARDIISIPIKADVVIISACSGTGTRAYSGEGLVGLVWAFLRAGAHRVIGALWDVDDMATPEFMDNFYTALATNRPAEALHEAKLKMLHSETIYHLPYYWATLQLYAGS